MALHEAISHWIKEIPDHRKTKEMCIKANEENPRRMMYVPDQYNAKEMCIEEVRIEPWLLGGIPDPFKIQEM